MRALGDVGWETPTEVEGSVILAVGCPDLGQGGEMGRNFFTISIFHSK